jgi:hypothetical protein
MRNDLRKWLIDWLFTVLHFTLWRRHQCQWRAAKLRPMLGLWAGKDLCRATSAVTRDIGFSGLIWRTAPLSRLLRHTREYGGSILTWILTGCETRRKFVTIFLFSHFINDPEEYLTRNQIRGFTCPNARVENDMLVMLKLCILLHHMQVKLEYYYIDKGSWRWRNWNHPVCRKVESLFCR